MDQVFCDSIEFYKDTQLSSEDISQCKNWFNKAISYKSGIFNPLNQTIFFAEKYFDIIINEPWAIYNYNVRGQNISGQLAVRGHIDLAVIKDNLLEVIDYKTGRRINWNTGKIKDEGSLKEDFQLRLYHYMVSEQYPQFKQLLVTVFYINDGGAFSIFFDENDISKTKELVRNRFEEIRASSYPKLIWPNYKCKWCHYGKNKWQETGKLICHKFNESILEDGLDFVTGENVDIDKLTTYQSGGGKL